MDIDELKYKNDNDVAEIFTSFKEEIESLKEELQNIKELHTLSLNLNADLNLEKSNLKAELEIHKGISDSKSLIINSLEKQIK